MINSREFAKPFIDARIFPANVRRVIIDAEIGQPVKVYFDTFADPALMEMITPQMLINSEPIEARGSQKKTNDKSMGPSG